ncbi:MAG: thioredoxin family protein [Bacilli bacterium]|nr:thioredoxin family protein [Bacilli bacterium]
MSKKLKIPLLVLACVLFVVVVVLNMKKQYDLKQEEEMAAQKAIAESISNLTQINVDGFIQLLSSEDTKIVLAASLECPHCTALKPKINELAKSLNVEINYLELSTMTQEEQNKFYGSNEFLKTNTSIPLVMAIRNNEVIDSFVGNVEKEQVEAFLRKNLDIK